MTNKEWNKKPIKNILMDINGVLFESGEDHAIEGSVAAFRRLINHGLNFCLVTNECTTARRLLAKKLTDFGFDAIVPEKIISPAPVVCHFLEANTRFIPRFHVADSIMEDFQLVVDRLRGCTKPSNCLVVGDVMDKLNRDIMDESLELMLNSPEKPCIISMGAGRYYKDAGRIRMDTGAYVAAFQYCLDADSLTFGKPTRDSFEMALRVVGGSIEDSIMIGDDIKSDVGGAQRLGMRAFLVRTGKYKISDEADPNVRADSVFDNLEDAINQIIDT